MIKKFVQFINESYQTVRVKYQDDDYTVSDNTFMDFDITQIPKTELKKQFVNFKSLVKIPPTYGDYLFFTSKRRRLNEGSSRETIDIEIVKESIIKNYKLLEWQFIIDVAENDIKVALVVPHIGENEDLIIEDMESFGYYVNRRSLIETEGVEYTMIKFDPHYPKDITSNVRCMKYIKHLTPKYNLESIKENGFVPLSKNEVFSYPPRVHFLKENIDRTNIRHLAQQLCDTNSDHRNNCEYVLLTLEVSKIPDDVKFIGDSCYKYGVCTSDSIPYSAVVNVEDIKCNKRN